MTDQRPLRISWADNALTIRGGLLPVESVHVQYLEAFCRPGSTTRDWGETVFWYDGELLSDDGGRELRVRMKVIDGIVVDSVLTAGADEVDFRLEAHNPTDRPSDVHWAQPCIRVRDFTGLTAEEYDYVRNVFIFLDGRLTRLPTRPWATHARYTPGQQYCPHGVPRDDVGPRPLSDLVPSNGLIGCFSRDERVILATAWQPYQMLFQGVIGCLHADLRIGGLAPGETKKAHGKIYVVPGDVPALLRRYEADFGRGKAATDY